MNLENSWLVIMCRFEISLRILVTIQEKIILSEANESHFGNQHFKSALGWLQFILDEKTVCLIQLVKLLVSFLAFPILVCDLSCLPPCVECCLG